MPTYVTSRRSGFSLLELMVTMGIAAMLMGVGAGVYVKMGRRSAASQAMRSLNLMVAQARKSSARFPATIVADPQENVIHAYSDEVVQELHFEARPSDSGDYIPMGIEGRECKTLGGQFGPDTGRVGGGLRVDGGAVDCGQFAAYDVEQGLNAELWIRPSQAPKCDLVSKGRTFRARLDSFGGRSSRILVEVMVQDATGTQDKVQRTVEIPPVRLNDWFGVRIAYDRTAIVTSTSDGHGFVVRDTWKESRKLAIDSDASLIVAAGLQGWLDDVRIGGIRSAEPLRLPGDVVLSGVNPPIRFLDGHLDPSVHSGSARLSLRYEGKISTFEIGQGGTVLRVVETDAPAGAVDPKAAPNPNDQPPAPPKKE